MLSDVARGSSTESARATLLRRGDADVGVNCADRIRSVERFSSTAADRARSGGSIHDTRLNLGQHLVGKDSTENHFRNGSENHEPKVQNRTVRFWTKLC